MHLQGYKNNATALQVWNNDCTVRALATVTGEDYMRVFLALQAAGRRPNSGFDIYGWLRRNAYTAFGHQFDKVAALGVRGTYLVGNQGHVWAVINGVMHDSFGGNRRYKFCYRVHKLGENEAAPTAHERASEALWNAMSKD